MTPFRKLFTPVALLATLASAGLTQERVPGPVLLKRIAEAVDGDRSGALVWVVARYDSTSPVRGVFHDSISAQALVARLGRPYDKFGPYRSPGENAWGWIDPCPHDGVLSIYFPHMCPPERGGRPPVRFDQLVEMELVLKLKDGTVRQYPFAPTVDAIFLTMAATDKFAMPYYARILGLDSAAALRQQFARRYQAR